MKEKFRNFKKVFLKRFFIFSSLTLPFILVLLSVKIKLQNKNDPTIKEEKIQTLIPDSIEPFCLNFEQGNEEIKNINIKIPNSRKWATNITKAYFRKGKILNESHRKRFNAIISYEVDKEICNYDARVRISGDEKESHFQLIDGEFVSSLDVLMKTGNINGITKFKLFLKKSRNGKHEVIAANIFSELGLLSPRTKMVNVNINGKDIEMVFQEKLSKEFVEHNSLRESGFMKINESLFWDIKTTNNNLDLYNAIIFPSIINHKWLSRGKINSNIGLNALNKFSYAIYESTKDNLNIDKPFKLNLLSSKEDKKILNENSLFSILSIITKSTHQFINHNRRFYFDPFYDGLRPVYYDGQPGKLLTNESFFEKTNAPKMVTRNYMHYNFRDAFERIEKIDINSLHNRIRKSRVNLTKNQVEKIKKQLLKNLKELEILTDKVKNNVKNSRYIFEHEESSSEKKWELGKIMLVEGDNLFNLKECQINIINCEGNKFDEKLFRKLARGQYRREGRNYFYLRRDINKLNKNSKREFNEINISNSFKLRLYGNPAIKINKDLKKINLIFNSKKDKVVIFDSEIKGWEINGESVENIKRSNNIESRFDENLLTGSLVIQNSELDEINLFFNNGFHEDSINIFNSKGNINSITILNSYQDALDLDFSILNINKLNISNAGNDCVDLSSGNYFINNINVNKCNDKGISIGEKSKVKIKNLEIDKSKIAIVVKDSSNVEVSNSSLDNYDQCAAVYRKKQEFGSSYLKIKKSACPENKTFIQYNSEIFYR